MTNCTFELTLYAIEHDWPNVLLNEGSSFNDARDWCKENCVNKFSHAGARFYFQNPDEATIFALRWV